jgi:hypothetical protein
LATKYLIPYKAGVKKKLDRIPRSLQKKIDQSKTLIGAEQQLIDALDEMRLDLAKEPHERHGSLSQAFREVWELSTDDESNARTTHLPMTKPVKKPVPIMEDTKAVEIIHDDKPPRSSIERKRRLFEETKEAILAEVPDDAKARFGQIYFTKWGKQVLPVLVMNPYSVPPGAARRDWLNMFDNVRNLRLCFQLK